MSSALFLQLDQNLTGQVGGKVRPPLTEVQDSEMPMLEQIAQTMMSA